MFLIQDSCREMLPLEPGATAVDAAAPDAAAAVEPSAAAALLEVVVVVPDEQAARPTPATPSPANRRNDRRLANRLAICRAGCGSTCVIKWLLASWVDPGVGASWECDSRSKSVQNG